MIETEPGAIYRVELSFNQQQTFYTCKESTAAASNSENTYKTDFHEEAYEAPGEVEDEEAREELYWDNKLYSYKNRSYNWRERDNPCKEYYYQDQIISQNLLASNLGIIAKKAQITSTFCGN